MADAPQVSLSPKKLAGEAAAKGGATRAPAREAKVIRLQARDRQPPPAARKRPRPDAKPEVKFLREPAFSKQLTEISDPAVEALQAKIDGVEAMLAELAARHAEMQQAVEDFQWQQYSVLGDCLAECLRLRYEHARLRAERSGRAADAEKARQAAAERDDFANARASAPPAQPELDDETRVELKRLYRAVAMRCHPDRVGEADKAQAHQRFQHAQRAYRNNDIAALRALLHEIDAQSPATTSTARSQTVAALTRTLSAMRTSAADLILAIQSLQLDDAYRRAQRRDEWADYFAKARAGFETEIDALRAAIIAMAAD